MERFGALGKNFLDIVVHLQRWWSSLTGRLGPTENDRHISKKFLFSSNSLRSTVIKLLLET